MFGELVCGPPGSGKTTYCEGKRQFLSVYDPTRPVTMLNLDPANEGVFPYPCDVDIRELVQLRTVMEQEQLGPNGSYLFCMTILHDNIDWLLTKLEAAIERRVQETIAQQAGGCSGGGARGVGVRAPYLLIDCPGQVEFYLHSTALHELCHALQKRLQCTLCTVHLVDAVIATRDVASYVSACTLCLTTMVDHELPHINLLSKWDTLPAHDSLVDEDVDSYEPFLAASNFLGEDFDRLWRRQLRRRRREQLRAEYHVTTDCPQPRAVAAVDVAAEERAAAQGVDGAKDGGRMYRYAKALMSVIDGYGLVGFLPLDVNSQDSMLRVTREVDNAVGNFV